MKHEFKLLGMMMLITLFACNSSNDNQTQFYPADAFFVHEIKLIDSLPVAIFHIRTENSNSDTAIFSKEEFNNMTASFFTNELKEMDASHGYKEVVLYDEQLKETTLSYTNENKQSGLTKVELHIKDGSSAVKSVYMERKDIEANAQRTRKILWISGKEMLVQSQLYANGIDASHRSDRFTWGIEN